MEIKNYNIKEDNKLIEFGKAQIKVENEKIE